MNQLHKKITLIFLVFSIFYLIFSQDNDLNLRVITYNIQTASNYRDDTPQNIDTLLNDWGVDILGTQELHMEQVNAFDEELTEYDWFGVARLDGDTNGETCVIFYNKNRLELLDQSTFWLSTNPDKIGSRSWDAAFPRIVTWGKFRMKSNNAIFFAYNTHFDHYSSLAREESAKLLKKVINEEAGFHPVLAIGDFNCRPDSTPYNFMLEHDDNILNLHDSKLVSEQGAFGPEGTSNEFTIDNPTKRIDYIFVNSLFNVKNYGVINEKPGGEFISDHFPVYSELEFNLSTEPVMPELTAYAGDGKVTLNWDKMSEKTTYEESILDYNDFQGYKLYRSRDPEMSDALINPGLWYIPIMRQPELVCDKIDGRKGHTNYGIVDGFGFYLGEDSGIQHFYIDDSVENGETYYYVLTAYDHGIDSILHGYQPLENSYSIEMDNGQIISQTKNTAIVTPKKYEENTTLPAVEFDTSKVTVGNFDFTIEVFDPNKIIPNKEYKLNFLADTLPKHAVDFYQHPFDMLYLNNGFEIRSVSNDSLILREDKFNYTSNNIVYDRLEEYYHFRRGLLLYSDVFDGLQLSFQRETNFASFASQKTGWIEGNAN
ncbi:MAG: endonuclease/exonuclease/phosphatase family protein, partial [Candidatus Marinimicrobia bacterium]|nr:endonuclease/exonuclease/phosphatase family protein [Candidatus Neomarinimicrobiota bacterium]